ncbi:MAG: ATP-dependent helicase HrpB, partial [Rhodanobacter sp.]
MNAHLPDLPITALLPQICASLAECPRLVLEAPPGAGKTTQVPLALLAASWLAGRKIIMLEPRRIAARAAAQFMAQQLGERVGQTVGYRIRFDSQVSAATRIEVVTEGILPTLIQRDPEQAGIGAIVFDEFHERHLAGDLGAALALDVQATLRPDLRLLVMSATLDGQRLAQWLDAPRLSSAGRSYPVRVEYPPARTQETGEQHLLRTLRHALAEEVGDILVFLPGRREIARAQADLSALVASAAQPAAPMQGAPAATAVEVLPLHGDLAQAEQQAALGPGAANTRRIVLATNVAESSVTLPGIRVVIDTGLAREPRFDPNSGFTRLQTVNIAQASADQRAGRAGRVAAGVAYRLWPQSRRLEASRTPEIQHVELSALALELAAWGVTQSSHDSLHWLDPPPPGALAQARELLQRLAALDAHGCITQLGQRMLKLGATPRLAAAALSAPRPLQPLVADLLALLEARSPLRGDDARSDDFRLRVAALHAWRDRGARSSVRGMVDTGALAGIEQVSKGWRKRLDVRSAASGVPNRCSIGDVLAQAFPDRMAHQDAGQPLRYTLANGRGARLHEQTALRGEPWLVVLDVRHEARDSLILSAAPLDPELLENAFAAQFQSTHAVRWNAERGAVEAFDEQRFGAIVLRRHSVPVRPQDALPALLEALRAQGLDLLPWSDAARHLRARIHALREWMPELQLP